MLPTNGGSPHGPSIGFGKVVSILVEVHQMMPDDVRDYASELHCLQQLDNASAAAAVLKTLLQGAHVMFLIFFFIPVDLSPVRVE